MSSIAITVAFLLYSFARSASPAELQVGKVPKIWDDAELTAMTLFPALPEGKIIYLPSEAYYKLKPLPVYKMYPVYHPDREPKGYFKWLQRQEPRLIFDPSKLVSESDWIRAGETVFHAPTDFVPAASIHDRAWFSAVRPPITNTGIVPAYSYVVRKKGVVEVGTGACANCHSRVLTDGTYVPGAQGDFPVERAYAEQLRRAHVRKLSNRLAVGLLLSPEEINNWTDGLNQRSNEEIIGLFDAMPPGVAMRPGFSYLDPPKIADLIGVRDRRYLDLTARLMHRSVTDIARYGSMCPSFNYFFTPGNAVPATTIAAVSGIMRYTDEQAYAFATYVYSLKPPPNPNRSSELIRQGQHVFERERCPVCHTPPLYTNNRIIPVGDFEPPPNHRTKYAVLDFRLGTDERAGLRSLRARGYYKVPSLKGVWYRGPFTHNGSIATLEDWFDARRLRRDYVPTGYRPYGVRERPVPGHLFGLSLAPEEKMALIAFLRTL
jgi:hypothetical protein